MNTIYRMFQNQFAILRMNVPYVKLHPYYHRYLPTNLNVCGVMTKFVIKNDRNYIFIYTEYI